MLYGARGVMLVLLAACGAGCATTQLTAAGQGVEVASSTPTGCRFVGTVSGYEGFNARTPQDNIVAVQAQLRNKAAELGGNVVIPTSQQAGTQGIFNGNTGWNGGCPNCITMVGSAYDCSDRSSAEPPPAREARRPPAPPPQGAAGFTFGADVAAAAKQCTDAGHTWDAVDGDTYRCGGTPVDTGLAAKSRLRFCGGSLCRVTLIVASASAGTWAKQYATLEEALISKYGATTRSADPVPSKCVQDPRPCYEDGSATKRSKWSWGTGQSVELVLGTVEGAAGIVVFYGSGASTKQGAPNPKAL